MTTLRVGLVSDTHDLLRAQAARAMHGSTHIVHAGDVCGPHVLAELQGIAPVTAVRGNNDAGLWARTLPHSTLLRVEQVSILVVHDLATLALDPASCNADVVVFGHSHRPLVEHRDTILYVNPGSAGPRRFRLPISVAHLLVTDGGIEARLTELEP